MKRVFLFFVFLILWAQIVKAEATETVITIEILTNGSALWTMEKRLSLSNQTEIESWEEFISKGQEEFSRKKDIEEFSNRIAWFMSSAENSTNRSISARNFNISYGTAKTMAGAFGIIRYGFEWENFSRIESSDIFIGDVFSEGMVLSNDNLLIIKIPDGYELKRVSPNFDLQDGNRFIWDGRSFRSFNRGEPSLVLSQGSNVSWVLIAVVMAGLMSGTSVILWKRRRSMPHTVKSETPPKKIEIWDEDMIEQYLIKSGGEAYQSQIVAISGFSKSKISIVLGKMKEEGRILKIRNGKENVIRLVKNNHE